MAYPALALERLRSSLPQEFAGEIHSARELLRAREAVHREPPFPTSLPVLDRILGGGLERGALTEILGGRSSGRFSAVLTVLAAATAAGESAALVDLGGSLDPEGAAAAGCTLERLLWVRPERLREALHASELLLGAGFPLVVLELGSPPIPGGRGAEAAAGDLATAWHLFKRHWRVFVLAQLAIVAAWVVLELAVVAVHRAPLPAIVYRGAWLALHLGFLWCFGGVMAGLHAVSTQAAADGAPTLRSAFNRFDRAWTYLLGAVLYWIPVLAGLCLGIVPGVALAARWALFRFVLAEGSTSAVDSLREAASLSASNRWRLLRVLTISAALNFAGAALLGVGLLITLPVTLLMRADYFLALRSTSARHRC